jgi:hypothetical protein
VFNGLLVKASGLPANTVAYLNLTDAKTNLTVYYRYRFAGVIDTTTTVYNIFKRQQVVAPTGDSIYGCATANYVKKSNRSALYTAYVNNAATALDSVLLVDAASEGAYIDARIPSLRGLSNRLVHRAELIITELPNQLSGRFMSPNLFLDVFDSTDNQLLFRPDFEFNNNGYNFGYFGGAHRLYNLQGENVYQYRFNMTRYLQNVVSRNGYIYKYFRVYAPFNMRGPTAGEFVSQLNYIANGRAVFAGGNHPNKKYKMMLRIIYSKI